LLQEAGAVMNTLVTDLDRRIRRSHRFHASSIGEYFRTSKLRWWNPSTQSYNEQETAIRSWLNALNPTSVLELGPGFGRITELLNMFTDADLTLVEINEKACRLLRKRFGTRNILQIQFSDLEWQVGAHDLVVAVEVLVHIPNLRSFLGNVHAALADNGVLITSITPLEWYEQKGIKRNIIHRGIAEDEFLDYMSRGFDLVHSHRGEDGQHITYMFRKK